MSMLNELKQDMILKIRIVPYRYTCNNMVTINAIAALSLILG